MIGNPASGLVRLCSMSSRDLHAGIAYDPGKISFLIELGAQPRKAIFCNTAVIGVHARVRTLRRGFQ